MAYRALPLIAWMLSALARPVRAAPGAISGPGWPAAAWKSPPQAPPPSPSPPFPAQLPYRPDTFQRCLTPQLTRLVGANPESALDAFSVILVPKNHTVLARGENWAVHAENWAKAKEEIGEDVAERLTEFWEKCPAIAQRFLLYMNEFAQVANHSIKPGFYAGRTKTWIDTVGMVAALGETISEVDHGVLALPPAFLNNVVFSMVVPAYATEPGIKAVTWAAEKATRHAVKSKLLSAAQKEAVDGAMKSPIGKFAAGSAVVVVGFDKASVWIQEKVINKKLESLADERAVGGLLKNPGKPHLRDFNRLMEALVIRRSKPVTNALIPANPADYQRLLQMTPAKMNADLKPLIDKGWITPQAMNQINLRIQQSLALYRIQQRSPHRPTGTIQ